MTFTNTKNLPLDLAVWLSYTEYDTIDLDNYISVTTLLKPLQSILLKKMNSDIGRNLDVSNMANIAIGNSIHTAIETAWRNESHRNKILRDLGAKDPVVYIEQRTLKEVEGFVLGGKFDLVMNGKLIDFKSTSVWSYIYQSNFDKYRLQLSLYRYLNPNIIENNVATIRYIFTDWSKVKAKQDSQYPQDRILSQDIILMSIEETDKWIRDRLKTIKLVMSGLMPMVKCNDEDLWKDPTVYKVYASDSSKRASKICNTLDEAVRYKHTLGSSASIKSFEGSAKACEYCDVANICEQYSLIKYKENKNDIQ